MNKHIKVARLKQLIIKRQTKSGSNMKKNHFEANILGGKHFSKAALPGVSVITCTNRPGYMEKVFANYLRQNILFKELIIILNNNSMNLAEWQKRAGQHVNIKVFQLDEQTSLGECFNFACRQCSFDYIAKFDDDDFYGSAYLEDAMNAFARSEAGIVGKLSMYVYFEGSRVLALSSPHRENCYVEAINGATMVMKKKILEQVTFPNITLGEDMLFMKECTKKGIKIYSTNRFNYVCIRRTRKETHTWQLEDDEILKYSQVIACTDDYITPTTAFPNQL